MGTSAQVNTAIKTLEKEISQLQNANSDKDLHITMIEEGFESQKQFLQERITENEELNKRLGEMTVKLSEAVSIGESEKKLRAEAQEKLKTLEAERNEINAKIKLERTHYKSQVQSEIEEHVEKNNQLQHELLEKSKM